MAKAVNLTDEQRKKLARWEPMLKSCLKSGDLEKAKQITQNIQQLLRPTGHETRILQAKNWLFETAMEAGRLTYAKSGFEGVIQKSSPATRLNLEATSLLAICYLREGNIGKSHELISKAVRKISNIKSRDRREQFHKRLIERLEDESIIAGLIKKDGEQLNRDEVDAYAVKLVMTNSEDQIFYEMGRAVPQAALDLLTNTREAYKLQLPAPDKKMLPPPVSTDNKKALGKRASSALKRVAWRAICSPESEIYKAWSQGLSVVYDKKYIAGAIVAAFNSFNISTVMIAASAAALAIKFGAEVFCETFEPNSMMIDKSDKG